MLHLLGTRTACALFSILLICQVLSSPAAAQSTEDGSSSSNAPSASEPPQFPADPIYWINSGPINMEAMQGKAVLLWYFEESCPRCREKWPSLMETSRKYKDKPIAFIAVNSGNMRGPLEGYVRQNRIDWPVLVDPAREFEKQSGVQEISLQNIHQAKVITPDGQFESGDWQDLDGTVEKALEGAEWEVDPASIPADMKKAWLAIEYGNYAPAAPMLKRGLKSSKEEVRQAAEKLQAKVNEKISADLKAAGKFLASGDKWEAYKAIVVAERRFEGFEMPAAVAAKKQELLTDPAVKQEATAMRSLENASEIASGGRPGSMKRAVSMLEKLIAEQPETEAAAQSKKILGQTQADPDGGGEAGN